MITDLDLNVQNLLNLIKDNEAARDFDLRDWFREDSECGTYGCLCGNWAVAENQRRERPRKISDWSSTFCNSWNARRETNFGLNHKYFHFLFNNHNSERFADRTGHRVRKPFDKEAAINRVRKLLYYYLRKRELLADDSGEFDWRKYEQLRRQEGERQISQHVLEEVSA